MRVPHRRLRLIEAALAGGRRSWVDCASPLERTLCAGLTRAERTALADAEIEAAREEYHQPAETAAREAFFTLLGEALAKVAGQGEACVCQTLAAAGGDPVQAARVWANSATAEERQQSARHLRFGHPREAAWWVSALAPLASAEQVDVAVKQMCATGDMTRLAEDLRAVWRRRSDFTCHCPWRSVEELLAAVASA